jgi:DNA-binding HxlR family transcriptional regulator
LLATSPNAIVLRALAAGPSNLSELQGRAGAPGSTLRARLKELIDADAIVAHRSGGFRRGATEYELTRAGDDLLAVAGVLEAWLAESSDANRAFGGHAAKAAIGALSEGWSASLLRALAAKPLSVADLDSLIADFNYPSLERRVAAMRHAGLVEARAANGRETPYAVTAWLRRGVAPMLAAIRWERSHLNGNCASVAGLDVEALFLLAMPLLTLDPELSGTCRLSVELVGNGDRPHAGVLTSIEDGVVTSCTSRLSGDADAWASGSLGAWLRALIDEDKAALELGGNGRLARSLISGLHRALFASEMPRELEPLA